jgi:hypothetical protein
MPLFSSVPKLLREVLYHLIRFGRNRCNSVNLYKEQTNTVLYIETSTVLLLSHGAELVSRSVISNTTIATFVSLRGRPCC